MPVLQTNGERISDLTIRATAISTETLITRQAWSDNFNQAKDRDRALYLLTQMSELTAEASTVRWTLKQLRELGAAEEMHEN